MNQGDTAWVIQQEVPIINRSRVEIAILVTKLFGFLDKKTPSSTKEDSAEAPAPVKAAPVTAKGVSLEGNVVVQDAESQLISTCEILASNPMGWLAIYLQPEEKFKASEGELWRSNSRIANIVRCQIAQLLNAVTAKLFLFEDGSLVLLASGQHMHYGQVGLHDEIRKLVYGEYKTVKDMQFDLSANWSALVDLAKQKYLDRQKKKDSRSVKEEQRGIDLSALQTDEFKSRLAGRRYNPTPVILVVEDDKATNKLVCNLLKEFRPTPALNAEEAINAYARLLPDLVLLDLGLPDVNGMKVLEALTKADPQANVVLLTASSARDVVERAIAQGAKGYIVKPFTIKKLMTYIPKGPRG